MNIARLRVDLELDEGIKHEIYLDHLDLPTFGIGHLIKESDPECGQPVGTPVTDERVQEAFERDLDIVRLDCIKLYDDFALFPEEVQLIIANMMFNLGYPRLSKFKNMKKAVDTGDWEEAANQMEDSLWYKQVPNRAERLCNRMRLMAVPF